MYTYVMVVNNYYSLLLYIRQNAILLFNLERSKIPGACCHNGRVDKRNKKSRFHHFFP